MILLETMTRRRAHLCTLFRRVHDDGTHVHDENTDNNTYKNKSNLIIFERIKDVLLARLMIKRGNETSAGRRLVVKLLNWCPCATLLLLLLVSLERGWCAS